MRVIDADKLMLSLEDWKLQEEPILTYPKPKEFTADDMQRMIWRTIRDCESAVEEQPKVKAIPIEWIRNYVSIWISEPYKNFALNMITKWEQENDSK